MKQALAISALLVIYLLPLQSSAQTTAKIISISNGISTKIFSPLYDESLMRSVVIRPVSPGALPDVTVLIENSKTEIGHQPRSVEDVGAIQVFTSSIMPKASSKNWLSREIRSSLTLGLIEARRALGRGVYLGLGSQTYCFGSKSIWNAFSGNIEVGCVLEITFTRSLQPGFSTNVDKLVREFLRNMPCTNDPADRSRSCNDPFHIPII